MYLYCLIAFSNYMKLAHGAIGSAIPDCSQKIEFEIQRGIENSETFQYIAKTIGVVTLKKIFLNNIKYIYLRLSIYYNLLILFVFIK